MKKLLYLFILSIIFMSCKDKTAVVGDFRDGGIVFWVDPLDNTHGLICDLTDYLSPVQWGCPGIDLPNLENIPINGGNALGSGAEIGDGLNNTNNMINDCPEALVTISLESGWFLPSINELKEIYNNRVAINTTAKSNGGHQLSDSYWSSSECTDKLAWVYNFKFGVQRPYLKSYIYRVRAVRYF
jgi:hypothetical protein